MLKNADWYVCDACEHCQFADAGPFRRQEDPPTLVERIYPQSACGHGVDYDVSREVTLQVPVEVASKTVEHCCRSDPGSFRHCCDRRDVEQPQRPH
jgi:hypothetical protein